MRTLTFWLRPDFVLRALTRFERIAGFDRAIALASSALTAMIPLSIVSGVVVARLGGKDTAERIIDRYNLTGGGAEAVKELFSPAIGNDTSLGLMGLLFLLLAALSFTRGVQRLFEQTWELPPLSVRNTVNGLLWVVGLIGYTAIATSLHAAIGHRPLELAPTLLLIPISAVFLVWSGSVLTARRVPWRDLVPSGVLGAVLLSACSAATTVYLPHLFSTYATRYGVIGAVFAMISALFSLMLVLVASAAAGREVHEELERIRRGQRPADDEIRRQWDELRAEARLRWQQLRAPAARRGRSAPP